MYDTKDPRSKLAGKKTQVDYEPTAAKYAKFYDIAPEKTPAGSNIWWARGQNFFLNYAEATDREEFVRHNQQDEYVVILPERESAGTIHWQGEKVPMEGYSIAMVPKGDSKIEMEKGGTVVRLFSVKNEDLFSLPSNKDDYIEPDFNVPPFKPWPESPEGPKVRVYSLDVPKDEGRFGRIFRCSTFMVNFLDPYEGKRDPSQLSPHSHADFEQCSLVLGGKFVHHFRWPWSTDRRNWKNDTHEEVGAPSVTVIPPGVIHTSEATGTETNLLVDIFSPPRFDFSKQQGWVLNADDYPIED